MKSNNQTSYEKALFESAVSIAERGREVTLSEVMCRFENKNREKLKDVLLQANGSGWEERPDGDYVLSEMTYYGANEPVREYWDLSRNENLKTIRNFSSMARFGTAQTNFYLRTKMGLSEARSPSEADKILNACKLMNGITLDLRSHTGAMESPSGNFAEKFLNGKSKSGRE